MRESRDLGCALLRLGIACSERRIGAENLHSADPFGRKIPSQIAAAVIIAMKEFRQRVEAVVEAFTPMRHDLDQERRAAERQCARRSRQIDAVTFNVSGMYGDPQGLVPAPQDRRSPPRMRDDRISDSFDWANSLIIGTAATPITTPSVSQCH